MTDEQIQRTVALAIKYLNESSPRKPPLRLIVNPNPPTLPRAKLPGRPYRGTFEWRRA